MITNSRSLRPVVRRGKKRRKGLFCIPQMLNSPRRDGLKQSGILDTKLPMHRTVSSSDLVPLAVEPFHPRQLRRQLVVSVERDLKPAGQPDGYLHVAKPQFFVDEIDIVVEAFAVGGRRKVLPVTLSCQGL